ncbi:class I SAM-dependent methyltransferase [Thalassospira lucentensis]|uniref:class I SAM-dependent methyltransferase n=1 Tax=Thalassospira lucentensis TaxID=168935 RepID=UPI003D2EC54B
MHEGEKFWDKVARRYAAKPIADIDAYERKLELARGVLEPDMCVVEIGCGTGSTAIRLSPYVNRVDAIDVSSAMLRIAKERAEEAEARNVEFLKSSFEEFDVDAGRYDAVLAHSILHLVPDLDARLAGIAQWLRPGGVFISNTTCIAEVNPIIRSFLPLGSVLGLVPPLNVFTRSTLRQKILAAGFEIDFEWPLKHGLFLIATKSATKAGDVVG